MDSWCLKYQEVKRCLERCGTKFLSRLRSKGDQAEAETGRNFPPHRIRPGIRPFTRIFADIGLVESLRLTSHVSLCCITKGVEFPKPPEIPFIIRLHQADTCPRRRGKEYVKDAAPCPSPSGAQTRPLLLQPRHSRTPCEYTCPATSI